MFSVAETSMTPAEAIPRKPACATAAKTTIARVALQIVEIKISRAPTRWDSRPQNGLATATHKAATDTPTPICHSGIPMTRDNGTISGFMTVITVYVKKQ